MKMYLSEIRFSRVITPAFRRVRVGSYVLFLLLALFISCDDYDSFTTDRSATLTFSRDTLLFDTLLTTVPSSTLTLAVYNRGDKGLRISEVWLEQGAGSPFRINIDGQDMSRTSTNRVEDFEVRRRDSIIVRAEVTLPEFKSDDPREVKDALVFRLESGIEKRVPLIVVGRDAFFLRACTLFKDTVFSARRPIVVYDSLVVAPQVTLTLQAGSQLYFHNEAGMVVHGRLKAEGTLENPVVLRGDRTDHIFDNLPYDNLPGRWGGVVLTAESMDNEFNYLDLHGGSYGIRCDSSSLDERKFLMTNSILHNLGGHGMELHHARVEVANSQISNTHGHCVYLLGGDATFVHCTLAQFMGIKGGALRGQALNVTFWEEGGSYTPLVRADFINCVITGYDDDVILMDPLEPDSVLPEVDDPQVNYFFSNCFLATEVPKEEVYTQRFPQNVYDLKTSTDVWSNTTSDEDSETPRHEKNFVLFDTKNFLYDFTPVENSPIRGIADPAYSAAWTTDRLGRSRLADGAPDAGCYEYINSDKND